ncbi:AAA family ATPase [Streptomyces sp. 3MP-14]|uniref:DNA 3'-5' helicase n=1 Tax=Streptomyces mimosae TaxID=2586635 RepID=A0A5N6A7P7_9ACTN|nr:MULTISPECIES: UvrD-helicase domain-containing protein [Streptomyces]KAB8163730.1 AAA family ATPase [Streptomyces mimosae]KAB8175173.1 AAA family ATPase [Streptomyces sp. 3MP-14]
MAAGNSAARRAQQARRQERLLREQLRAAGAEARRWEAASEGERRVAAQLLAFTERGWRLLVDRRWPGTRAANVDMLLVGQGGVFVLDVKNWRAAPEVRGDALWAGGQPRDEHARKLARVTGVAEGALVALGLSPVAVRPLMVFAGHRFAARLGPIDLLGEAELAPYLWRQGKRLPPARVRAVAERLAEVFPAYRPAAVSEPARRRAAAPGPGGPGGPAVGSAGADEALGLFDVAAVRDAALADALAAPIERWMTFLHSDQASLVRRDWAGPARISGPAGTGKTVVALHRAARLARSTNGRLLYVTFANNLPRVQRTFLRTLAPSVADRVEFSSLHAWAGEYLRARGVAVNLRGDAAEAAFGKAWFEVGRHGRLPEIDRSPQYWRDEIHHVIKGRGLTGFEQYATVRRLRRRTALRRADREAVWELYEAYERRRAERGLHDFNDVLAMALERVRGGAPAAGAAGTAGTAGTAGERPYRAVVVDEVQDLTLVGVRLLHALVGDAPNGLLLVGDGQQAVYPGGFRLAEAGVDIRGDRAQVLRRNYRNGHEILRAAMAVVADDTFEDIDGERTPGRREVDLEYRDGAVVRVVAPSPGEQDRELLDALRALTPDELADAALLCASKRAIDHYQRLLARAGVPVCPLEGYAGSAVPGVKLGSYRRAKGLEFKRVFLPHHDEGTVPAGDGEPSDADRERAELARGQLFVAMTRARDLLWLGSVKGTAAPPRVAPPG